MGQTISEKMKTYIAESLLLLMKKKLYAAITIGEITSKAGVNRSTYYRNFKSKEDIVKFYYNKILFRHRKDAIGKNETLKNHFLKMLNHYLKYKEELLLLHKNGLSHLLLDALNDFYTAVADDCSFEKRYRIYWHTGAVYNSFLLWFSDDMNASPEKMNKMYTALTPQDYGSLFLY